MMRSMASHVPHSPQKARNPMSKTLSASKNPLVCTSQLHINLDVLQLRPCDLWWWWWCGCLACITLSSDWVSVAAVWWHLLTLDLMRPTIIITSLPAFDYNASLIFYSCTHPKQFPFAKHPRRSSTPIGGDILLPASPHHRLVNILTVCAGVQSISTRWAPKIVVHRHPPITPSSPLTINPSTHETLLCQAHDAFHHK
jgi:hypothetical protein